MSKRRLATPSKETLDSSVAQSNGSLTLPAPFVAKQDPIDAKLLAYVHDERHFSFVRYTCMDLNGFCGIMSIFNSLAFCASRPSDYTYLWKALGFLPAGLLADFFDGKVARWRGKSSLLGQELDSLADLVPPHNHQQL